MSARLFIPILLPFLAAAEEPAPLRLSLAEAVEIAVSPKGSARVELAAEAAKQAEDRSRQARGALLPNLDASFATQSQTRNLEAFGLRLESPLPGFRIPTFVGPYTTIDGRVSAQQSIFDFSSIRRYQASRVAAAAAHSEIASASEQVAGQTARAYLAALKATADVEAIRANITLAEAVVKLAESQKRAGTGTGIEITRARVQLSSERQRLFVAQNDVRRAQLQVLRAMNVRLDTPLELTGKLAYVPVDSLTLEQAKARALTERPDMKAQQQRESNARLSASSVKFERLPSVAGFGDYGASGTALDHSVPTRTYGISVRVPLFDGGRRDARRAESASQLRAEQTRSRDLRQQVELDVRLALDALASAEEQVKVAREGLELSESELAQARRRYEAGVAVTLEITDAQTRLERARDNQTAALFNHNLARIDLAQAMGAIRRAIQ
jgi:outer membrane protein TolC